MFSRPQATGKRREGYSGVGCVAVIGKVAYPKAEASRLPAHETVYRALRARILYGEMAPGQPVTIQGLTEDLGAGMTPVREAIRRLTAEGALVFQGNRRVSVPRLSPENVGELIFARAAIEPQLALRATRHADLGALDRLAAEDARLDTAIAEGDLGGYLRHNHGFHAMLYEVARAPILAALADGLWLRFGPSLRVVCGRIGTQNLPDRHKETLSAMRAGDAEAAAQAIREDVLQGMELVRAALGNRA